MGKRLFSGQSIDKPYSFSCKEFIKGRGLVISINEKGQFHGGKFSDFKE